MVALALVIQMAQVRISPNRLVGVSNVIRRPEDLTDLVPLNDSVYVEQIAQTRAAQIVKVRIASGAARYFDSKKRTHEWFFVTIVD